MSHDPNGTFGDLIITYDTVVSSSEVVTRVNVNILISDRR